MNTVRGLDQLEQSAYRSRIDPGLIDIIIGAVLVAIGLMLHADLDYMPVVVFFIGVMAYREAGRRLIEPRIGHVRLRADHVERIKVWRWFTLGALVAAVSGVLALRALGWIDWPASLRPLVVTGCFALPLALAAGLFGVRRWFVYAVVLLAGGAIEAPVGLGYGTGWYFSGGFVLLAGGVLLARFLRAHPAGDGQ